MGLYRFVLSAQTRKRYWLVLLLILSGITVTLSSIYFLYFPNGYQGGRNPDYNVTLLFTRTDWSLIHIWSGVVFILVILIHIPVHWKWIMDMGQRCFGKKDCTIGRLNPHARLNLYLDAAVAVSFVFVAISSVYFLLVPNSRQIAAPQIVFDYATWDVIHTWSGILMIIFALVHLLYHRVWVLKVSSRIMKIEKVV
jgi:hypothetical protein